MRSRKGIASLLLAVALLVLPCHPAALRADEILESNEDELLAEFDAEYEEDQTFPDPLETTNRRILAVNEAVDRWVLDPIIGVYVFVVPEPARYGVRNFFANLRSASILANDLLQMEWKDAGITAGRFTTNTVIGFGGFFDPAQQLGMPEHDSDFGQTLALVGVPSGPYLVIPLFGPMTVREGTGLVVDMFFRPTTYLIGPLDQLFFYSIHGGGAGIVYREEQDRVLHALRESSVDYYAALRNAYFQHRMAFIYRRRDARPDGAAL